ncbi:class I adenylate-forming enzyme family protein [Kitasatospora sp. NPDC015120]|uniref:class I adenylate-forming enzyme family protein n=1 Tax=Kitasatospora sp. NPDC015120 TaxID=3364023 RepID=UPI0036F4A973
MWFSDILDRHCQQRGDAPAVVEGANSLTWRRLRAAAQSVAALLRDQDVGHGDPVAVHARNRFEVIVGYFALAHLGAPFVPVNHAMSPAEFTEVAERLGVRHVIGERRLTDRLGLDARRTTVFESEEFQRALATEVPLTASAASPSDPLAFLLTSGTTGKPKGVLQTSEALRQMTLSWLAEARADDSVRLLNLNSLAHGGVTVTFHYLAAGATLHLMREFQPRAVLRTIAEQEITHLWMVPQMLRFLMMTVGPDAVVENRLREIMFGASPMSQDLLRDAARAFGCGFRNVYGMTEAGGTFCTWAVGPGAAPGTDTVPRESSGRSVPGITVEIHDEDNRPLPVGEIGEVCVLAPGRMSGYVGDPVETGRTVVDGWVRTGDLGVMDANGFVHLKDRIKDVIKRGGQNVFPAEVENAVAGFEGVRDTAVIGVPDEVWGEVPLAFVVTEDPSFATARLLAHLHGRLASYKLPREVVIVPEIPRNGAGKILRRVLAEQIAGRTAAQASARTAGQAAGQPGARG